LIIDDEFVTFDDDDAIILFWWSTRWLIWTSTSGVSGDRVGSWNNGNVWKIDEHESLFGRWIGPGTCWGNGNGSILNK
jgi:hypothetical protein